MRVKDINRENENSSPQESQQHIYEAIDPEGPPNIAPVSGVLTATQVSAE